MSDMEEIIARWNTGEGRPYKGSLIDWDAYEADHDNIGCMCAQGQVLHLLAGWSPERLTDTDQMEADKETADLLKISRAHAILLRNINDKIDGAPAIVLTDPGKVLGDHWSKLLDFWWMFHCYSNADWQRVAAARVAARGTVGDAIRVAAGTSIWASAWGATAKAAAGAAPWGAAVRGAAGGAAWEIQGLPLLGECGHDVFFLPMFGIKTPDDIPPRPADYGLGIVPHG